MHGTCPYAPPPKAHPDVLGRTRRPSRKTGRLVHDGLLVQFLGGYGGAALVVIHHRVAAMTIMDLAMALKQEEVYSRPIVVLEPMK